MLTILRECGMRPGEFLRLRACDYSHERQSIFIRASKGSMDREIPLKMSTALWLERWIGEQGIVGEARLFAISYLRLWQIWDKWTPVKGKGIKSLRHSLALRIYRKTRDIQLVKRVLGHRCISSTMVYAEMFYSEDEMRRALF
jgi:integrase/recombinase XerD